jgi:lipoyl(octanoyl) transferase
LITGLAGRWRFLDSGAADGATNMAVDAALLDHARGTGEATLRVYAWSRPTVSFGRHERARPGFAPDRLAAEGIDAVRRPTGGRALLHHREVTYSVTAPAGAMSLAESYRAINALLLAALRRLGVPAEEAPRSGRPLRPDGAACFAEPAPGELTVAGAKLVGSAQLREEGALLQHGSILLADDQTLLDTLRSTAAPRVAAVATLTAALAREVDYGEVRDALRDALRDAVTAAPSGAPPQSVVLYGGSPSSPGAPEPLRSLPRHLHHFSDPAWTWRR